MRLRLRHNKSPQQFAKALNSMPSYRALRINIFIPDCDIFQRSNKVIYFFFKPESQQPAASKELPANLHD
ncbi:hypothetical protein DCC62_32850 [candidate division KSB1 bacterium]|nr:MAG: hypothetical protein DCC62_32850 [candidate division KSB1 bacterium]